VPLLFANQMIFGNVLCSLNFMAQLFAFANFYFKFKSGKVCSIYKFLKFNGIANHVFLRVRDSSEEDFFKSVVCKRTNPIFHYLYNACDHNVRSKVLKAGRTRKRIYSTDEQSSKVLKKK